MLKRESTFSLKFEGDSHQIDANTLINVLTHYNNIVKIANAEYGGGSREIGLNVTAIEPGSFDIHLCIDSIKNLFSEDSVLYLAGLTTVVGGVIKAYKWLKGKRADANNIQGLNIEGDVEKVVQIYNQPVVREAISKSVESASADANVEGLTFSSPAFSSVTFSRKEFADLIYTDFDKERLPSERSHVVDTYLTITQLNFERGGTWRFLFDGFPISMVVKDDALMDEIDKGARFGKGDTLHVRLKISQRYDERLRGFKNVSFRIETFIEHLAVMKERDLFE